MKFSKTFKVIIVLLLAGATQLAMASFTGSAEKRSRHLYSLKSFNKNFYRPASSISLKTGYTFKNSRLLNQKTDAQGNMTFTSLMRYEKGNTTYISPLNSQLILPKFKIPTSPTFN